MRLLHIFKGIFLLTLLALIYIHLQIEFFRLAYQAQKLEEQIHFLVDKNSQITYSILKLKSPNHLGNELLSDQSDMQFLDQEKIVRLQGSPQQVVKHRTTMTGSTEDKRNPILQLLAFMSQAEAKPAQ